jgi:virginiamycin B lyase
MRRPGLFRVVLASAITGLALSAASAAPAAAKGPQLCRNHCATAIVLPAGSMPFGITKGPLGSVWFSLYSAIGRVDRQGRVLTYPVPSANAWVGWMTTHPGNTVWFAERGTGKIGHITANGTMTEFSLPTPGALPQGIVFAPDGNIYVSEQGANAIARLNPVTGKATDIPVPTPNATVQSGALGPDGAIWFIERSAAKVGRMTLDGRFTEYPLTPGSFPNRIVTGPDGALWFTELFANKVGRITTNGRLSEYPVAGGPVGITVGRDRQLYVDLFSVPGVARVDLKGEVTGHWALPGAVGPLLITTGFGLDIWVTDTIGDKIYRLTPYSTGR